ncbi:hypothetical protein SUDANB1_05672 [Streptomyces sp. enrichment culture]|uniref:hypothetical protein n=1 Tax=Streptomyces sp. enrichment culture TaxID=1795815 RepID=UPI003F55EBF4
MAGTGASVYLPPIAGQYVYAGGGLALPASGAWTPVTPTTSSDHTIKESGLYLVTADTRAAINVPAGGNIWVVGAIARNGTVIGGSEHLAHQIANTTVAVGTNEGSGTNFLVFLTAGDVLSMVACARGTTTAAGAAASVIGNGDGYTRASWVRVRA